jgi:hypothetical protein
LGVLGSNSFDDGDSGLSAIRVIGIAFELDMPVQCVRHGYKWLADLFRGFLKRGPGQAASPSEDHPVRRHRAN